MKNNEIISNKDPFADIVHAKHEPVTNDEAPVFPMPPVKMPEPEPASPGVPVSVPPWELGLIGSPEQPIKDNMGWTAGGQIKRVLCTQCSRLNKDGLCSGSPNEVYRNDPRTTHCPDFRKS